MTGEMNRLVEFIVNLPEVLEIGDGMDTTSTATSKYGECSLSLNLTLKYINDMEMSVKNELEKTSVVQAFTDFEYLTSNYNLFPENSDDVRKMWGDKGFISCSEIIQYGPFDKEVYGNIKKLQGTIDNFSSESERISSIISLVLLKIMDPKPTFIDENGKQCQLAPPSKCFPSILRDICGFIQNAGTEKEKTVPSIDILNTLTKSLSEYCFSPTIPFETIISLISTAYGVIYFIDKNQYVEFEKAKPLFSDLGKSALIKLLNTIQDDVNICIKNPLTFCDKLSRVRQNLSCLGIPESTLDKIDNMMLEVCDFFVTRTWIMNEDMGIKSLLNFTGAWPQYQFILLNSLIDITQFCGDIVNGALPVTSLHKGFQGPWLLESLRKLAPLKKLNMEKIRLLPIDMKGYVPQPPDIEQCVESVLSGKPIQVIVPNSILGTKPEDN